MFYNKVACDGSHLHLSCRTPQQGIAILSAFYGSTGSHVAECPPKATPTAKTLTSTASLREDASRSQSGTGTAGETKQQQNNKVTSDTHCQSSFATERLTAKCVGKRNCSVPVDAETLGPSSCKAGADLHIKATYACVARQVLKSIDSGSSDSIPEEESEDAPNDAEATTRDLSMSTTRLATHPQVKDAHVKHAHPLDAGLLLPATTACLVTVVCVFLVVRICVSKKRRQSVASAQEQESNKDSDEESHVMTSVGKMDAPPALAYSMSLDRLDSDSRSLDSQAQQQQTMYATVMRKPRTVRCCGDRQDAQRVYQYPVADACSSPKRFVFHDQEPPFLLLNDCIDSNGHSMTQRLSHSPGLPILVSEDGRPVSLPPAMQAMPLLVPLCRPPEAQPQQFFYG